jgi:diacylglycerol O-acyltransferase-1
LSKEASTFVVFFLSAVFHEVLVSVPFHMVRPWSFLGMMMQLPLVGITKFLYRRFPGSSIGNIIFWIAFCVVGQPMAIMLYTVDYQYGKQAAGSLEIFDAAGECVLSWGKQCFMRW